MLQFDCRFFLSVLQIDCRFSLPGARSACVLSHDLVALLKQLLAGILCGKLSIAYLLLQLVDQIVNLACAVGARRVYLRRVRTDYVIDKSNDFLCSLIQIRCDGFCCFGGKRNSSLAEKDVVAVYIVCNEVQDFCCLFRILRI